MSQSYVTITDQFCGAGGSSIGAVAAGAELRLALNHWRRAIETHNTNFPDAAHDCTDISACDPRRYPSTDVLITSPECTNHSLAKGRGRARYAADLFGNVLIDPADDRSRATMWDVPRFAEYHRYRLIIVENVVDASHWILFDAWLTAMHTLGYQHRVVYLNSMFAHPTPQSRDRMYVVFWRGVRAPDLDIRPIGPCGRCGCDVEAMQSWKPGRTRGKYGARGQYVYRCPECDSLVHPYYYPAASAIDWSLPIQRIGDRAKPLKEKTLARIRLGLERFGGARMHLHVDRSGEGGHLWPSDAAPLPAQTARQSVALVGSNQAHNIPRPVGDPMQTVLTGNHHYILEMRNHGTLRPVSDPLATVAAEGNHHGLLMPMTREDRPRPVDEPYPTQTATETYGLATVPPFLTRHYTSRGGEATLSRPVSEPLGTVTASDHHSLTVPPPFIASYYGEGENVSGVDEALPTQPTRDRHGLVMPFVVSQYGGEKRNPVRAVDQPMPTVPGMHVHHIAQPAETPRVEDCGFRMLEPHEIQAAMAFPASYIVTGNKRERVKQLGNAVTPPVMSILVERCLAVLS